MNDATREQLLLYFDRNFTTPDAVCESYNYSSLNTSHFDIINSITVQVTFCILYTAIFILGLCGNMLVCFVVLRNKSMHTVTNLFILNLALSDIFLCVLAVPFTPLYTFLGKWVFGPIICHLVPYAQGISVYISTLTLTAIAIDRFFVIIYPFHPRMKIGMCVAIILSIWIFSILVTLPYGVYVNHKGIENLYFCEEFWPSEQFRKIFGTITTTLQFLIPFLIIAVCYICVSLRLNDRAKAKPGAKSSRKEEVDRERKKRTNRMLIAMVAIFGISWLPLNVINVVNDFYLCIGYWRYYHLCFFVVHAVAMSSTCYNPFLYAWLNENFRKEFKQVLPCVDRSLSRTIRINNQLQSMRSERTCNGNETVQESFYPSSQRKASFRCPSPIIAGENTSGDSSKNQAVDGPKADQVEVENIMVPVNSETRLFNSHSYLSSSDQSENIKLRLMGDDGSLNSSKSLMADHDV